MSLSRTAVPRPYDQYDPYHPPKGMDAYQQEVVLSAFPAGSRIAHVKAYRTDGMAYPLRVQVMTPDKEITCVLKLGRFIGGMAREAALLPVLAKLGLPVPTLLAGPATHPDYSQGGELLVISEMPGEPLPFVGATLDEADLTCRLLQEGLAQLHGVTKALLAHPVAAQIPHRTLPDELNAIVARGGPWLTEPAFCQAIERLRPILDSIDTPIAFSNGDYNPLNFLHVGERLTACIDFACACFEDPHASMAKFAVWGFDEYGWGAGVKAGLVERYLYQRNVSRSAFAPRLALRCLYRLQREISVAGQEDRVYREAVLAKLTESLSAMAA